MGHGAAPDRGAAVLTGIEQPPFRLCMVVYRRRVPWVATVVAYPCTSPRDHEGDHSWQPLADADEAELVLRRLRERRKEEPPNVGGAAGELLQAIFDGKFDPVLEKILAVGHERKRARRGVRTFE